MAYFLLPVSASLLKGLAGQGGVQFGNLVTAPANARLSAVLHPVAVPGQPWLTWSNRTRDRRWSEWRAVQGLGPFRCE